MFYGKNLQIIRMLHGLSRKELGEKLRVSEQSIWQFEKQMIEPSFENILQMKEILQVKSTFFFEEFRVEKTFLKIMLRIEKQIFLLEKKLIVR